MRIVGVLDLVAGRAVRALAGRRDAYQPVQAVAGIAINAGDATALAHAYVERLGLSELYVADLDAIRGGTSQGTLVTAIAAIGAPLWLDAGISSVERARHALDLGAARVIVALETLPSFEALREVCDAVGGDRVVFSLDLREGQPIVAAGSDIAGKASASQLATRAADVGASAVMVIDLARVGTSRGIDLDLIERVRKAAAGLVLVAGGGVRGLEDLASLADAGCDAALVATALQDGRIGVREIAAARTHPSVSR